MSELNVQIITLAGIEPVAAVQAVLSGDTFDNDGFTYLEVINGGGGDVAVTIVGQRILPANTSATRIVTVSAGTTKRIGPFPKEFFNTDLASEVAVSYDQVTTVTVRAFSVKSAEN